IRSVDTHAKLRHRLGGLRVVTVGAGQQSVAGEAAFALDAVTKHDAAKLRAHLLGRDTEQHANPDDGGLARLPLSWVLYNMFSIWSFVMAAGLLWGAYWMLGMFGINLLDLGGRVIDWESLAWPQRIGIVVIVCGAFGAVALGVNFLVTQHGFELSRVQSGGNVYLRTRRGLLSTREVNRDEARRRGLSISEPVLWRWMGMADTNIVTTGLSVWDPQEPTAILPRGPVRVARRVA